MPGRVADASIIGSVVFGEPRAGEALELLGAADLYEPTLLAYELASVARKKVLRYPDQRETLLQALEMSLAMEIGWVEINHLDVVSLALETGLTTYDASYLYLARNLGIPLVTFDSQLQVFAAS